MWTCQIHQIILGGNTKLFTLSESAINARKKPELVHKILALKRKVIEVSYILKVVIDISHKSCLEIELKHFKGCHCLPISRNSRDSNKRVITNLVNRKHPEALLQNKMTISSKDFSHLNVHGKVFVSVSLSPHYQYILGKSKDLQRRGKIPQGFCHGGTVAVKVTQHSIAR